MIVGRKRMRQPLAFLLLGSTAEFARRDRDAREDCSVALVSGSCQGPQRAIETFAMPTPAREALHRLVLLVFGVVEGDPRDEAADEQDSKDKLGVQEYGHQKYLVCRSANTRTHA